VIPAPASYCVVFSAGFLGGSELFNLEFMRRAAEQGAYARAILPERGAMWDALEGLAAERIVLGVPPELTSLSRFDERVGWRSLPRRVRALAGYLRRLRREISRSPGPVVLLGFRAQLAGSVALVGLGRTVLWVVHEVVPAGPFARLWQLAARRADLVLTYSRAAGEQRAMRGASVRVAAVRLELDAFAAVRPPQVPPRVLGLVGDLFPIKNHLGALEVIRALRDQGHEVRGLLVGRDAPADAQAAGYADEVRQTAQADGSASVTAAAPGEMSGRMAEMDLLLHLTTVPESFGRVCVEAMAAGRPVVAFDHGAVPEVVRGAGVLCPPGDLDAVARTVAALRADEAEFSRLSAAARALALERFGASRGPDLADEFARFVVAGSA
jgi:glycosyltransferase involved in cell wall biosynthesis